MASLFCLSFLDYIVMIRFENSSDEGATENVIVSFAVIPFCCALVPVDITKDRAHGGADDLWLPLLISCSLTLRLFSHLITAKTEPNTHH